LQKAGQNALSLLEARQQTANTTGGAIYTDADPVQFIEQDLFIAANQAPMQLHPRQRAVLREMFRRDDLGLVYDMLVYSSPKKSAKTTIGGGLALWHAFRKSYGEVYIVGNDLKQADSRMSQVIRECITLNPNMRDTIKLSPSTYKIKLPNGCRIESLPIDPSGEAGMNPDAIFWTEAWGAKEKKHNLMWSEAALSSTKLRESFIFVESYAGHSGESLILENLYNTIVKGGQPLELYDENGDLVPEVYVNGRSIAYWCTEHYLPWQQDAIYLASEATRMTSGEFRRVHFNEWTTSTESYVDITWWDACHVDAIPITPQTPQILALDAGVTSDCFAAQSVTKRVTKTQCLKTMLWQPQAGKPLDFDSIEADIVRYCQANNVLEIVYDPYQLAQMAQRLRKNKDVKARVHEFEQGGRRAEADTNLRQKIMNRNIEHDGDLNLRSHIMNADSKSTDDSKLRLVKRHEQLKIDAVVALSMAAKRADELALERFTK
jgi:phage terminase large subunit-like protein